MTRRDWIPDRREPGVRFLLQAEPEALDALGSLLRSSGPASDLLGLVPALVERTGWGRDESELVLTLLSSLYLDRVQEHISAEECASRVATEVQALEGALDEVAAQRFKALLGEVLSLDTGFGVAAKAFRVQITARLTLCGPPLIATDLRPVFSEGEELTPAALVVLHTLELRYHDANGTRELSLGLLPGDLSELESLLKRARAKELALLKVAARTGVPVIRTEDR